MKCGAVMLSCSGEATSSSTEVDILHEIYLPSFFLYNRVTQLLQFSGSIRR